MKKGKAWAAWLTPGLVVVLLDRVVKWSYLWVTAGQGETKESAGVFSRMTAGMYDALTRFFAFLHGGQVSVTQNSGMAFGWFQGNSLLIVFVSIALVIAFALLLRGMRPTGAARCALSLMAGGAVGNMIDRLLYGYVVDMFDFFHWFVFNVADVGVVAGAILCGWSLLFRSRDWSGK